MEEIYKLIQSKLNEIQNVESGAPIPDGLVMIGTTYFGYELSENYRDGDLGRNYTMEISLLGRLVRYNTGTENTAEIMHEALESVKAKLKELNFKYSYQDVSFEDNIRKIQINAYVRYNELINQFVV